MRVSSLLIRLCECPLDDRAAPSLPRASVTRLDEVRAANGLSTNTPLADLINGSYFAFPDVSTTDQEVPVISPSLCTRAEAAAACVA